MEMTLKNQFNFSERASQTQNNPFRVGREGGGGRGREGEGRRGGRVGAQGTFHPTHMCAVKCHILSCHVTITV